MSDDRPPPEPDADAPLRRLGPYQVLGEIGGGGMGVVYRAVGPSGEAVAVKSLRGAPSEEIRRRFDREATIRVDHPNVVRMIEAGADGDDPYIALELLEGESLEERLARGPLRATQVVDLGEQICRGLAAAHARGIIHRDLKPSNLFICKDGTIKILDFGIALEESRTRVTSEGGVIGTPSYMSPEQVRGDMAIDRRTDIWSVGAVLYEALSGRPPFQRDTALAVMLAVHLEEPEPLWAAARGAPPGLCAAIEKALSKPPPLRWASAAELGAALGEVNVSEAPMIGLSERPPSDEDSFGDTIAAPLPAVPSLPLLIPAGEHRIVAVILAEGVRDLGAFGAAVLDQGGSLLPLVGHRAIGLFGAETWEGDEVVRAVSAALGARRSADRMAVASGRARSALGGISGDVLRAAEAGCAAGLSGVAVDGPSARSLGGDFSVQPREGGVFEIAARRTGEMAPFAEAPLLGRDAEVAQLKGALARVLDERRSVVVLVSGPPGIGKTRLRREMEALIEAASERIFLLSARAESRSRETARALIASALRDRLKLGASPADITRVEPELPPDERRAAVLELARSAIAGAEAAADCAQFLGELVGVPMPDSPALRAARADPLLMSDRLRLSLLDLCEGLAEQGPLGLVLEDLQWADRASRALIDDLLDRLADQPLLVFATARPELLEADPALFSGREVIRVEPRGLGAADVVRLSQRIAGRPLPEALTRAIAERTAGHPLFVEQIVLELRDQALFDRQVAELPMTLTVEAAVQSRLDHLPPGEKDACKRASVLGRPFTTEELTAMGVAGAAAVLGSLGRRDLLAGRARAGGGRGRIFQFRSTLVADVAYSMIADETRRDLHRRAALYLGGQPGADDEEVATHHERGGEPRQAAERYAAAAVAAAQRGDTPTVLRCSERSLSLGAPVELRFRLHMARADALGFWGRRDDQDLELQAARDLAENDAELARVLTERTALMMRTGRQAAAPDEAAAAVAAALRAGDPEVLTLARARHVGALIFAGKLQRAAEVLAEARSLASAAAPRTRAFLADAGAQLAGVIGDLGERREAFETAAMLYREAGDLRRAAGAEANLADAYNRFGAYAEAEAALRQALESGRRVNNRMMEGYALVNLGYSLSRQGKTLEALEALQAGLAIATAAREPRLGVTARSYLTRARLAVELPAKVAADAEQVAVDAEAVGEHGVSIVALSVAAAAHLVAGDTIAAVTTSARAMAGLDALGGVEEDEAEVFVTHAHALEAAGRSAEAVAVRSRGRIRVEQIAGQISDPRWREQLRDAVAAHRELLAGG